MKIAQQERQHYYRVAIITLGVLLVIFILPRLFKGVALWSVLGMIGVVVILATVIARMRSLLQKRIQELSTLSRVSQVLRSSLELNELLPVIQEQVMEILGVNYFYVALFDVKTDEIWYPLAVKAGQRQSWPRRRIADRLTDRVIREGQILMLTPQIQSGPNPVGFPASEENPQSWLGVPLVTPEKTIGCLAVFDVTDGVEFSHFDIDLLTTISSQVGIAIENALLYDQLQYRAAQLETLNHLTSQITASLDLDEVLDQVCHAVGLVGGSQRSAIYLQDTGMDIVYLAHASGMSDDFTQRNQRFSIGGSHRTRCLRTGKYQLTTDVPNTPLPVDLSLALYNEKIAALADFPLITPDGQIGFLSVYYDSPHDFSQEEIELLQTLASQAALAVNNARLHTTTDENLARRLQQLAILEAVGRELSAATLSERLFLLILDFAMEFTQAPWGVIGIYDDKRDLLVIEAQRGYPKFQTLLPGEGISGRAFRHRRIENIPDITQDAEYINIKGDEVKSQLSVPIFHEDKSLGVITLESNKRAAFSSSEQALVQQIANQAAVALVNAQLHHETQRHLHDQSILYQITARFVSSLDVSTSVEILYHALDAIAKPCMLGIYLLDENRTKYCLQPSHLNEHTEKLVKNLSKLSMSELLFDGANTQSIEISGETANAFGVDCSESRVILFPMLAAQQLLGLVVLCYAEADAYVVSLNQLIATIIVQASISLQNVNLFDAIAQQREQLTAVINSVEEAILMFDSQAIITLANQPCAVMTGLSIERLVGMHLAELSDGVLRRLGYDRTGLDRVIADLIRGYSLESFNETYQSPDILPGDVYERTLYPVMLHGLAAMGWMMIWRDMTEEHRINQEREAIADALIHDLRSPISAVLGSVDLLDEIIPRDSDREMIDRSLGVARRGAKRVLRLITSLLDVARMQSGDIQLHKVPVDLSVMVQSLLDDLAMIGGEYGIVLQNDFPKDLPIIFADEDKISRVLQNLLDNAVKFSPENKTVRVSAVQEDEYVKIQVFDHGPGVAEEFRSVIFERFSQISGQLGRWRGAGLGLAFCKIAVEAHGGSIEYRKPPNGQGSIFSFTLPIH